MKVYPENGVFRWRWKTANYLLPAYCLGQTPEGENVHEFVYKAIASDENAAEFTSFLCMSFMLLRNDVDELPWIKLPEG